LLNFVLVTPATEETREAARAFLLEGLLLF